MSPKVVDVDSHTCEPTGIWEENLEPEYRDRALRMKVDDNGWEYLEVDGKKPDYNFFLSRGIFGRDSAVKRTGEELEYAMTPGNITYEEGRQMLPAAKDPGERVKMMDSEGIDVSMLIDLFSISWDPECSDAKLAAAYARVANDWLIDHCSSFPSRLVPIPHIPMRDPQEAAKELRRVAKLGVKAVTICCRPFNDIPFGDPYYDPFWAEAQELDMPVAFHIPGHANFMGSELCPDLHPKKSTWWVFTMLPGDMIVGFTSLIWGGALDRFPKLKVVLMEAGVSWIPWWLDRMGDYWETFGFSASFKLHPSEYFQRQCWASMEPDDHLGAKTAEMIGADKILWAADYPHSDATLGTVSRMKDTLSPLPDSGQRQILGQNAVELFRL